MIKVFAIVLVLLTVSCVKHEAAPTFEPITTFSGRLLVMDTKHRFQVELDWMANEKQGNLRITHALSGRVVFVQWKNKVMFWRDNDKTVAWESLSKQELKDMGVILPPWTLARIFLGQYPKTMQTKDEQLWKGTWDDARLQIKWSDTFRRVEITDFKQGKRAIVIIHE
ncbi:MAG: hypothetical protein COB79_03075 [Zetaproteobacteria bacterium]|nr:MAG: hypothetical protein COB79_03075 [Zetaproteobacteria bacterium]